MRKFTIIFLFLTLAACAKLVPVGCPRPTIPPEPRYPVQDLRPGDRPDKVAKAYVATVRGQHDYIQSVKHIVGACE